MYEINAYLWAQKIDYNINNLGGLSYDYFIF